MNDIYLTGETNRHLTKTTQELSRLEDSNLTQHLVGDCQMLKENESPSLPILSAKDAPHESSNRITNDLTNFNNYTSETDSVHNKTMDETIDEGLDELFDADLADVSINHANKRHIESFFNQVLEESGSFQGIYK